MNDDFDFLNNGGSPDPAQDGAAPQDSFDPTQGTSAQPDADGAAPQDGYDPTQGTSAQPETDGAAPQDSFDPAQDTPASSGDERGPAPQPDADGAAPQSGSREAYSAQPGYSPYTRYYDSSGSYSPYAPPIMHEPINKPKRRYGGVIAAVIVVALVCVGVAQICLTYKLDVDKEQDGFSFSFGRRGDELPGAAQPAVQEPVSAPAPTPVATPGDGTILEISSTGDGALSYQEIYKKVAPSVVSISSVSAEGQSTGTGIIMSADGYIITNHHVVSGASSISVIIEDGSLYSAAVVGSDETSDLAVLKLDATGLTPAEFGSSNTLQVGDPVLAIGDPLGIELRGTLTDGIISAINRDIEVGGRTLTLLQTNAALNSGNSGGPLINDRGQVIGVNTMKMSSYYASVEGLGFAIPISLAKPIVDELIENGYVSGRPAIGITGEAVPEAAAAYYHMPRGVYVSTVDPGSDAYAKGITGGDIITSINGVAVTSVEELNSIKNTLVAGETVTLTVYRGGEFFDVDIVLADRSALNS